MRTILRWLFPGGAFLLVVGALLAAGPEPLLAELTERYRWLPYAIGLGLGVAFHRSRVVIAVLAIAAFDLSQAVPTAPARLHLPFGALTVVLMGLLATSRDRGVFSSAGLAQVGVTLLVLAGAAWGLAHLPEEPSIFDQALFPPWLFEWTLLGDLVSGVMAVSLIPSLYAIHRWRGAVERSVLWAQVTLALALRPVGGEAAADLLLMAAVLILALSVLQTSYAMAYRDELTGLPARRSLKRDLDSLSGTYTLAMVDVDHFKRFNDTHGHDVGDQVLMMVATLLSRTSGGGKAYRYGGEEFTLLFKGRLKEDAAAHLEAVRASIEDARFTLRRRRRPKNKPGSGGAGTKPKRSRKTPRRLSVTVSIGAADTTEAEPGWEAILKQADKALYRAKRKGRNQVSD